MKVYSKRRSWITVILFAAVLATILFMALRGFGWERSGSLQAIGLGLDLRGGVSITYEAVKENPSQQDMTDTIRKIQLRVADYSNEAQVYQVGANQITVDIPGQSDADQVLKEIGQPGSLIFCTDSSDPEGTKALDGNDVANAQVGTDNENNYIVLLQFTEEGQAKFAEVTGKIAGTEEPLYIMYDGEVISNPTAKEQITSVSCQIEGNFTYDQANQLASFIRIGALPVELKVSSSSVVGATLGSNAISTSLLAGAIGIAIVCLLMILLFRMPGFTASLSLILYAGLMVVILSLFNNEITLTLPGIAGIILGIGMAVDANVIIFSRIREEIGLGNSVSNAIDAGFKKALSAVVDGNVTTLIAAAVLFIFGNGPVKGFATTLAIGIVLSMFTALAVTRFLLKSLYGLGLKDAKWYGSKKPVTSKNFLGKKGLFFAISGLAIVIGVAFMIIHGMQTRPLNLSLDFVGGYSAEVPFETEGWTVEKLESEMQPVIAEAIGSNDVALRPVVGTNRVNIRTAILTDEQKDAMYDALDEKFGIVSKDADDGFTEDFISNRTASDTARSAIISVIIATVFMLLYIWIRFRDLRFASSSVIALLHDVLVVVAGYAVFRWTVGNTFIACMLTLVGYSINATIVIFDRIRENLQELGAKTDVKEIVNLSITQTLGRSIYTSLTTLIMVVVLYILGVTAIREFALPLMVGIVVGGYSSVCLAGAVWYLFKTKIGGKKAKAVSKKKDK